MRRILVIGAKGMLGRDLMEVLRASSSDEVTGWDIDEVDIRIEKDTVEKMSRLRPEVVINLAAFTNVDECESQVERAFAVNAEGMRHVALGALRCHAKVVYVSTDYVFDGKKGEPPHLVEGTEPSGHPSSLLRVELSEAEAGDGNHAPSLVRGLEGICALVAGVTWCAFSRRGTVRDMSSLSGACIAERRTDIRSI